MFTSEKLTEGSTYTRSYLRRTFGINDATLNTGIFQPSGYQSIWLFVTENKAKGFTPYKDLLLGDTLEWDGQTKGRKDRLIIEHEIKGLEILVFYRTSKRAIPFGGFKYEGQFRYVRHSGSQPAHFILERIADTSTTIEDVTDALATEENHEEETSNSSLVNKYEHSVEREKAITIKEQPEQLKLVYCYARKDKALREALDSHLSVLKHNYHVITWFDHEIGPGIDWEKEIDTQLNTAHIILLLVSPDFMASKYCYGVEMRRAIERHERGEAKVIPIILRPISWQDTPLGKLQGLPRNGKPVVDPSWGKRDYALHNVEKDLKAVIHNLISMPSASSVMPSLRAASAHLESENGQDLIVFKQRGQEDAYRKWVLAHRADGLIVVKDATRWHLHHATCRHIIDPIEKGQSLLTYPKFCSTSRAKLDNEATKQGGTISMCHNCYNKYPRS
ncbi:MAG TPA: TIR domain-containing protein [Ktedonobacteraceae bacterium]|nr:TIR domain-containing protein [Ktedonobacteraceae bacterium]